MDIHKPKPWHGLRELLKEIGIIVVGVLIALAAEQFADRIHWSHKVAELRRSMTVELAEDDGPQAYYRLATRSVSTTGWTRSSAPRRPGKAELSSRSSREPIPSPIAPGSPTAGALSYRPTHSRT
jgi:hypothetical protein